MNARLVVVAMMLWSSIAIADEATANTEYAAGQKAFRTKDYAGAATRFVAAYAADPDPVYLFNAAQAYRLARHCDEARDYYQRFLDAAPQAPNRDQVERWLAEVEACATPTAAPVLEPDPRPAPTPPAPVPAPVLPPRANPEPTPAPAPPVDHSSSSGRRTIGVVTVVGGVVAVGVGAWFVTRARAAERDREGLCPVGCTWDPMLDQQARDIDDRGHRASTLATVSLAVGGAAIVGGAVLYLTAPTRRERVVVAPTPGGARVGLSLDF